MRAENARPYDGVEVSGNRPAGRSCRPLDLMWPAAISIVLALVFWFGLRGVAADEAEPVATAGPTAVPQQEEDGCLECHSDPARTFTFPNGDAMSLSINMEAYGQSAHARWLDCAECHDAERRYPHPLPEEGSLREYAVRQYELCKSCHYQNYTRTLDSIHVQPKEGSDKEPPICTDCHDAHSMKPVRESRLANTRACSKCHDDVYEEYAASVHGSALQDLKAENQDVPDCVTCHGVHNITGAATASFRQKSVEICGSCHADKEMMDKYDISSDVMKTYLDDFHGKTVGFYQRQTSEVWPEVAVCTDCHGVHDIKKVDDPESTVIKENLLETCRKCHEDASSRFPSAWLSHYRPSLGTAPLVWVVRRWYQVLIPLMVGGLGLNIALDVWRAARRR